MRLFHQLLEEDQHNAIHYCMHLVIDDMIGDGVQLEPFSEEDGRIKLVLEKVINEARGLPKEEQFDFIAHHKEAGAHVFDIALDMARSSYYHPDEDMVIYYESLRFPKDEADLEGIEELPSDDLEEVVDENDKKSNLKLN